MFIKSRILFVLIIAILLNIYAHRREISNPYFVERDITSKYVIYTFDSSLFKKDVALQYIRRNFIFQRNFVNIVLSSYFLFCIKPVVFLSSIFLYLKSTISLAQILIFLSMIYSILAAVFVYKICACFMENRNSLYCVLFFLVYSSTMDSFTAGMERGAGFALVCALYYYLLQKNGWKILVCVILTLFLYSNILPFVMLASVLILCSTVRKKDCEARDIFYFSGVCIVISYGIYLLAGEYINPFLRQFKDYMQWKFVFKTGHLDLVSLFGNFIFNFNEHSVMYKYFTIFLLVSNLIFLFRKSDKKLWQGDIVFICSSVLSFLMILPFHPGSASRQLVFTLPLFLSVIFFRQIKTDFYFGTHLIKITSLMALFAFMLFNNHANQLCDLSSNKKSYEYFSSLPKNILIAGHPNDLEYIPFFARQSVFLNPLWLKNMFFFDYEFKKSYHMRYLNLLRAIYSSRLDELCNFLTQNSISYLYVNEYFYSDTYLLGSISWYEKEKRDVLKIISANHAPRNGFVVLDIARQFGKNMGNGFYIVDCRDVTRYLGQIKQESRPG